MSISPSYLQHKYKQMFQRGIKRDITLSRLELGRYLLSNSTLSVADISRRVGYENDVHFMRVFKNETGFTPTQYRKASLHTLK
jgi:AraC family transcriptional regulator of arabinose operon